MAHCKASTQKGGRCSAKPGSYGYCYFHDPAKKLDRLQAQSRGGQRSAGKRAFVPSEPMPEFQLRTVDNLVIVMEHTLNKLLNGEYDAKMAHAVSNIANSALRAQSILKITNEIEHLTMLQRADHELELRDELDPVAPDCEDQTEGSLWTDEG